MPRRALTSLRLRALDARDRVVGRTDPLVPPRRLQLVGRRDFVDSGDEFFGYLLDLAGLAPSDRVLDVRCGTGRMARPLAVFLDPSRGSYDGFDVDRAAIGWCRRRYARRHPHFRFLRADLFSESAHPGGAHRASEYRFPYDDQSFDLVLVISVLNRLLEEEAEHYLAEAARVMADGGHLFATFFVLDDVSRARIAAGEAGLPFLDADQHVAVLSEDVPDEAVAYDEDWIEQRLAAHGLRVTARRPGTWSGRDDGLSFEDIVVAARA